MCHATLRYLEVGGAAATEVIVVHAGQVVVQEAHRVDHKKL